MARTFDPPAGPSGRTLCILLVVGACSIGWATLPPATVGAVATDTDSVGNNTFSTTTIQPPAGLSATPGCQGPTPKVDLGWTASISAFADGYDVLRGVTPGGPYTPLAHVAGASTTTYRDETVAAALTYHYVVRATAGAWVSVDSNEATAMAPVLC